MDRLIHRLIEMRAIESRSAIMLTSPMPDSSHLEKKMKIHLGETYRQIKNLEICLAFLGLDHVPVLSIPPSPHVDCIALYVWKHLEIAHYLELIQLCKESKESRIASLLGQNLEQDNAMANWLQMQIAHSDKPLPNMAALSDTSLFYGQYQ